MPDRIDQINEEVLRALSSLAGTLKDPRLQKFYSFTHVEVSRDFKFAKVYVSVMNSAGNGIDSGNNEAEAKEVIKGLKSAAGLLRRELGAAVRLHHTPELSFILDHSLEQGAKINDMLAGLHIEKEENAGIGREERGNDSD